MKRGLLLVAALTAAITLTGCDDPGDYDRRQLELGQECFDSGGDWVHHDGDLHTHAGWGCEFKQEDQP